MTAGGILNTANRGHRSGRSRRSRQKAVRQQQRMMLAAAGALAFVTAAPLTIAAYLGTDPIIPGLETAKSFLAMLSERSPGERTAAELLTKHKRAAAAPRERALGKIHNPAPPPQFLAAIAPPPPSIVDLPPFEAALTNLGPLMTIPGPPGGGGGIVTSQSPPGGGGGGGGGGGDTETPPEQPPPPPPVPEPGTWATMLLGFGMTGWLMRRRRRSSTAYSWA